MGCSEGYAIRKMHACYKCAGGYDLTGFHLCAVHNVDTRTHLLYAPRHIRARRDICNDIYVCMHERA